MKLRVKTFRNPEGSGADRSVERWLDGQSEKGDHIMINEIKQTANNNWLFTTLFYTKQDKNIVVNDEEETPESITNFRVKKFIEGKTLNFNLFLKEVEIKFLKSNINRFSNGKGIIINEFESEEHLIMLQDLREKGILYTYKNSNKDDVFRSTVICEYFNDYYLSADKPSET
jgi:hypothetical protein